MPQKTARDLAVPLEKYPHALETQTLREAVQLLETESIHFDGSVSMPRILLVFNDSHELVGMVRRRDILRGLEPRIPAELDVSHPEAHIEPEIDPHLTELLNHDADDRFRRQLDSPIADVVRELPGRVAADDSIMRVVRELVGKDTHIAAVLDDGEVIGVVRTLDLLRAATADLI